MSDTPSTALGPWLIATAALAYTIIKDVLSGRRNEDTRRREYEAGVERRLQELEVNRRIDQNEVNNALRLMNAKIGQTTAAVGQAQNLLTTLLEDAG